MPNSSISETTNKSIGKESTNRKTKSAAASVQIKLTVGQSKNKYEREANKTADHLVNQSKTTEPEVHKTEEAIQPKREILVQREEKEELQMKAEQPDACEPQQVGRQIEQSRGGGSPLSAPIREQMESGIGADFSKVRIHTGSRAENLSQQINAQAFTTGNDIYFNKGKYNPESQSGKHLLAHELTHTVQQGASETVRRQAVPASNTPTSIISQFTGTFGLDETGLANHLYALFTSSSANLTLIFQTLDALSAGNRDDVAFEMMNPLNITSLQALAQTDDGRQLMARMRYYLDDGYVSGATDTLIGLINQAGSGVTTPSTGMSPKTLNVQIVEYAGYTGNSSSFQQAVNDIFQQCAVSVSFSTMSVNATDTATDLNNNVLNLSTSGSTSESNNVLTRASAGGTMVAAMVEDIKVNNLTGFAGFTPPGAGLVAVSNRSNQTHTLAHEIGHFLGLNHVGSSSRLMYEDNNTSRNSLDLTPWESSIIRSRV